MRSCQAYCAARVRPLAGMELRGPGEKSVLRARGSLTRMHSQTHSHRSLSLPFADLLTRRRSVVTLAQHLPTLQAERNPPSLRSWSSWPRWIELFCWRGQSRRACEVCAPTFVPATSSGWGFPACHRMTVITPMIRSRRMSRCWNPPHRWCRSKRRGPGRYSKANYSGCRKGSTSGNEPSAQARPLQTPEWMGRSI